MASATLSSEDLKAIAFGARITPIKEQWLISIKDIHNHITLAYYYGYVAIYGLVILS